MLFELHQDLAKFYVSYFAVESVTAFAAVTGQEFDSDFVVDHQR
jgi:hypothetical protein